MRQILLKLWLTMQSNLWLLPGLIVLGCVLLGLGLIEASVHVGPEVQERWPWLFGAGAEGARGMLQAIATSMITVAGVSFSIVIVALTVAASQYTSRILRNFMRDRATQIVLGVFVGIFAYCLVVIRSIRGETEDYAGFVPVVAVMVGVVLGVTSIGFLIYFIHHIAASIQASEIIASIADETAKSVDDLFPETLGEEEPPEQRPNNGALQDRKWNPVGAPGTGYIQAVDQRALLTAAENHDLLIRMERAIGDFVAEGSLVAAYSRLGDERADVNGEIERAFLVGRFRTVEQDAAFGVRQMVDIALRALSPGINDTTTATTCIDYLGAILRRLAPRRIEEPYRGEEGDLRVIARGPTFQSLLADAFDHIRATSVNNREVQVRLLAALESIAETTVRPERRRMIWKQAILVAEAARDNVPATYERARVQTALDRVARAVGETAPSVG
jgi:uncharacterized membrane protein